jgi:DNA-binding NarL/FixJ family response regulator
MGRHRYISLEVDIRVRPQTDALGRLRRYGPPIDSHDPSTRMHPPEPAVSVLIADDQALVRAGFRAILDAQPDITVSGEARDGYDAVDLARRRRPDVVLMDVRMPGLDGLEATRRIINEAGEHPIAVLMLTTFDLNEYVYAALRAGASGFLLKDVIPEQLIAAVRIVAAGDALIAPAITKRLIEQFARSAPALTPNANLSELTPRELEVLKLIARGLANHEIAAELFVADATVKTHVTRILTKLHLRDRVQAVVLAYETGVVSPGSD